MTLPSPYRPPGAPVEGAPEKKPERNLMLLANGVILLVIGVLFLVTDGSRGKVNLLGLALAGVGIGLVVREARRGPVVPSTDGDVLD